MELQLRSDSLFLSPHSKTDGIQYQIHCLLCSGLVGHNAVIIEIPDHGQVKDALAENFFSILKTECIYRQKIATFQQARELIDEFIYFYNHERIQLKTGVAPLTLRHST